MLTYGRHNMARETTVAPFWMPDRQHLSPVPRAFLLSFLYATSHFPITLSSHLVSVASTRASVQYLQRRLDLDYVSCMRSLTSLSLCTASE